LRNFQRVRRRLPDDADADAGAAVGAQRAFARIGAERDAGDIAELDPVIDVEVFKTFRSGHIGGGAHHDVGGSGGQRSSRHIQRHIAQGGAQIGQRQAEGRQTRLVDINAENLFPVAIDSNVGDAGHRRQPVDHHVLDQNGHVLDVETVRRHREAHHRVGIGVGLDDAGIIGAIGHVVGHPAERIADIGGRDIEIGAFIEFNRHPAAAQR